MINKLVIENLKHRWVRTLLSALVVGVQVMSILTLIGLSRGLLQDSANRAKGTGADIVLQPDTKQGTISFASGQVKQSFVPFVAKQPHVRQAVGVLTQSVELITSMNGVNFDEFQKISGGLRFLSGGPPQGRANGKAVESQLALGWDCPRRNARAFHRPLDHPPGPHQ